MKEYTDKYGNCLEDVEKVEKAGALNRPHLPGGGPLIDGTGRKDPPKPAIKFPAPDAEIPDFPAHLILCAMIENLVKWMLTGEAPEKVDWIEMEGEYPDMKFARDSYGVFKGGLRSPYVDCPLYATDSWGVITRRLSEKELKELEDGGYALTDDEKKIYSEYGGLPWFDGSSSGLKIILLTVAISLGAALLFPVEKEDGHAA